MIHNNIPQCGWYPYQVWVLSKWAGIRKVAGVPQLHYCCQGLLCKALNTKHGCKCVCVLLWTCMCWCMRVRAWLTCVCVCALVACAYVWSMSFSCVFVVWCVSSHKMCWQIPYSSHAVHGQYGRCWIGSSLYRRTGPSLIWSGLWKTGFGVEMLIRSARGLQRRQN